MKRLLFLFVISLMTISSAYAIKYRNVGLNAEFCVYTFESQYYLILSFKDTDDNRLTDNPIVKFKMSDGSIMRFEGYDGSKKTLNRGVHWGYGIMTGSSSDKHFAIFPITTEEIEQLKIGVEKVVINTVPEIYMRDNWTGKAKFGSSLNEDFKNLKNEFGE